MDALLSWFEKYKCGGDREHLTEFEINEVLHSRFLLFLYDVTKLCDLNRNFSETVT